MPGMWLALIAAGGCRRVFTARRRLDECCVAAQASVIRVASPSKIVPWPAARQAAVTWLGCILL